MILDKIVHSGNYQHNQDARYFSDDENSSLKKIPLCAILGNYNQAVIDVHVQIFV